MLDKDWVYFRVDPAAMTLVTRLMEGFAHLGVVTAWDGRAGIGFVRTTRDTAPLVREILAAVPLRVEFIPYESITKSAEGKTIRK